MDRYLASLPASSASASGLQPFQVSPSLEIAKSLSQQMQGPTAGALLAYVVLGFIVLCCAGLLIKAHRQNVAEAKALEEREAAELEKLKAWNASLKGSYLPGPAQQAEVEAATLAIAAVRQAQLSSKYVHRNKAPGTPRP